MIKLRSLSEDIIRPRQDYDTRLDKVRLGMNERYPSMPVDLFNEIMSGYTIEEASAYPELKTVYETLAKYINQPPERILLAGGADVAIKTVLESVSEKGDVWLTCKPTYVMYKVYAKMLDCTLRGLEPDNQGNFDLQQLIEQAKQGVKVVILANPNGVTGFYFNMDEIKQLLSAIPDTPVILDEAYADFAGIDGTVLLDEFDNLIIIRTFSKNVGFTGLQVGYTLAQEHVIKFIEKFKPTIEINSLAARAIKVMCSKPNLLKELVAETVVIRRYFSAELQKLGFDVVEKGGNFILVDFGKDSKQIQTALDSYNIEFKPAYKPFESYVRFAIADKTTMDFVLQVIINALGG